MREFGTVVSFDVRGGLEAGRRCVESLQLFAMVASLGSNDSLVLPPQMLLRRGLTPEQRAATGIGPGTVRLSIGLESVEDLLADLAKGLAAAQNDNSGG
jgi:O-acetylhomoserine (thiol)-lyase